MKKSETFEMLYETCARVDLMARHLMLMIIIRAPDERR